MCNFISHFTAAEFWDIPCLDAIVAFKLPKDGNLDLTVPSQKNRLRRKGLRIHSCQLPLPDGALVKIDGRTIASPELVFLQLATHLNIHELILLGLQLCSYPPGKKKRAVTSKLKIKNLLMKAVNHQSRRKALRAMSYVEDGSASIMESLLFMALTLPHALGGYGIKGAKFNVELGLKNEAIRRLGQSRCFVDLYYKDQKVGVEYDSFTHHNGPAAQGKDAIRSEILARQGVEMMHISTIQLYEQKACADFATNLALRLGKRIQIRTRNFAGMNRQLRSLLPSRVNVIEEA